MDYHITGGSKLSGVIDTNVSKNAAMALLAASLLNDGVTVLKKMPRIEEVNRLVDVLQSIGVFVDWQENNDMHIHAGNIDLSGINRDSASKTRSIAMFIGPLAHRFKSFELPAPTGCDLGKRSLGSHIDALAKLGIHVSGDESSHTYHVEVEDKRPADIVMYEASDTGTENVLMAAAKIPGITTVKFASSNYMVQDLCFFLQQCGVQIYGIGTSKITVHGVADIKGDIVGMPSEDPIESMFFFSLAATTGSDFIIRRCPLDFIELELFTLKHMGLVFEMSDPYKADNGQTLLVDVRIHQSLLKAPSEKIAAKPYPGINIDNLPFFVPVATQAVGNTMIHDWVYEGRAQYYMEMAKLGADMTQLDPHRVLIRGPVALHAADIIAPPALRPATLLLIGMLASKGESILRNVYPINRGYANMAERLTSLGATIRAI